MTSAVEIRVVRCTGCKRVYDAQSYAIGASFTCICGESVPVRAVEAHASPVIRCSSCGGSRAPNAHACTYCGAAFTLRERDLTAMCASCGGRASQRDSFCTHCGDPIVHGEQAARTGDKYCPVCVAHPLLVHRNLNAVALMECPSCGGVWLDKASFAHLAAEARDQARTQGRSLVHKHPTTVRPQKGPAYRRCVECDTVMQRKNYGRKSGVIVDVCAKHGIWFDLHEMEEVLGWLRAGGVEAHEATPKLDPKAVQAIVAAATPAPAAEPTSRLARLAQLGGDGIIELIFDVLSTFRQ